MPRHVIRGRARALFYANVHCREALIQLFHKLFSSDDLSFVRLYSINAIPGVYVLGTPDMSVVCFGSNDSKVDIYKARAVLCNYYDYLLFSQKFALYGLLIFSF